MIKRKLTKTDFIDSNQIEEAVICPLCKDILYNPVSDGSHIFCRDCIEAHITKNGKCPIDKLPLTSSSLTELSIVLFLLDLKQVYCTHRSDGCDWTGVLSTMEEHLNNQCLKQNAPCPYQKNGCDKSMIREDINNHMIDCIYRSIYCKNQCEMKEVIIFKDEKLHLDKCPNELVDCPKKCGNLVKRQEVTNHYESCPLSLYPCVYKVYGCTAMILNIDKQEHLAKSLNEHNELLIEYINKIQNESNDKVEHISNLEQKLYSKVEGCLKLMQEIHYYDHNNKSQSKYDKSLRNSSREIIAETLMQNKRNRDYTESYNEQSEEIEEQDYEEEMDNDAVKNKRQKLLAKLSTSLHH